MFFTGIKRWSDKFGGAKTVRPAATSMLALVAFVASWALSSAPLASPDEQGRIASIWCAPISLNDSCRDRESSSEKGLTVGSPQYLPNHCYFRNSALPARCTFQEPYSQSTNVFSEGTFYLPGFQIIMNVLISSDGEASTLRMKLFNGLLFATLLAMVMLFAPCRIGKAAVAAVALVISPFSIWLITSINSSSWGIAGMATSWVFVPWIFEARRSNRQQDGIPSRMPLAIVAICGFLLSTTSRLDTLVMFVVVVVVFIVTESSVVRHRLSNWRTLAIGVPIGSILTIIVLRTIGERFQAVAELPENARQHQPELWIWITSWVTHFPQIFMDAFGVSGLGENDVRIPQSVWILALMTLGAGLLCSLTKMSNQQLSSAAIVGFGFACILWFASREMDLYNVPGRYVMPLFPAIVGSVLYYSKSSVNLFGQPRLRKIAISLLGVVNALSLYTVVERYVAGSSGGLRVIPIRLDEWWWQSLPIGPNAVVLVGSAAWPVFLVYAFRLLDVKSSIEERT